MYSAQKRRELLALYLRRNTSSHHGAVRVLTDQFGIERRGTLARVSRRYQLAKRSVRPQSPIRHGKYASTLTLASAQDTPLYTSSKNASPLADSVQKARRHLGPCPRRVYTTLDTIHGQHPLVRASAEDTSSPNAQDIKLPSSIRFLNHKCRYTERHGHLGPRLC